MKAVKSFSGKEAAALPAASPGIWGILYSVLRYLFPFLALSAVFLILLFILSEARTRREKVRSLPGAGTVGELIVLSGSNELDINTWFPVPREGVLGSVRSCDLVVPCPGVHAKHLDFSWEDGIGLLIRPRTGCEALINGVPVNCRAAAALPLTHGGILQVGSALLRLHLFAALDNTAAPVQPPVVEIPGPATVFIPEAVPDSVHNPVVYDPYGLQEMPDDSSIDPCLQDSPDPEGISASRIQDSVSPRSSDRWKEDFGE